MQVEGTLCFANYSRGKRGCGEEPGCNGESAVESLSAVENLFAVRNSSPEPVCRSSKNMLTKCKEKRWTIELVPDSDVLDKKRVRSSTIEGGKS